MDVGAGRWQRILLSGGLLEPAGGRRTVRDWIVDLAIVGLAAVSGAFVLAWTWDRHAPAVADMAIGTAACAALLLRRERPVEVAPTGCRSSACTRARWRTRGRRYRRNTSRRRASSARVRGRRSRSCGR